MQVLLNLLPVSLFPFAVAGQSQLIGCHSSSYRTSVVTKLARCLLFLNPLKKIAVSIFLVAFSQLCLAQSAPELIHVGDAGGASHFLIADSIQSKNGTIRYKILGRLTYRDATLTAEVGVDCVRRTRTEYLNVITSKGSIASTTSDDQARTVFDGTRQASELDTVCDLAAKRLTTAPVVLAASPSPLGLVTQSQLPECRSAYKHNCVGTETLPNGNKYVGEFKDDKRNGQGTFYAYNGSISRQGLWENDRLVQSFAIDAQRCPFNSSLTATQAAVPDTLMAERDRLAAELEASRKNAKDLEERLAVAQAASSPTVRPTLGVPTGRRVALVIGNAQYKSSPLENSVNDATDIDQALKRFGFQTTFLRNASLSQMR